MKLMQQMDILDYLQNEKYDEALDALEKYEISVGNDSFYYLASSDIYLKMEDYNQVLSLMYDAIEGGYDQPEIYERISDAYLALHQFEDAKVWLAKCDRSGTGAASLHILCLYGYCLYGLKEYKEAVNCFEDVLLETDDNVCCYLAGCCYVHLGNTKRAAQYFEKVWHYNNYIYDICRVLCNGHDLETLEHFLSYISGEAHFKERILGEFYQTEKQTDFAIEHFENAASLSNGPEDYSELIHLYLEKDTNSIQAYNNACKLLETPFDSNLTPEEDISMRLEALNLRKPGKEQSKTYLRAYLEAYSNNMEIYLMICDYALEHDLSYFAFDLLFNHSLQAMSSKEQDQQYNDLKVKCCLSLGRSELAYDLLMQQTQRTDRTYMTDMALACYDSKRYDKALEVAKQLMPDGLMAVVQLAIYDIKGNRDETFKVLDFMQRVILENEDDLESIPNLTYFTRFLENLYQKNGQETPLS
jgi:tetratricopeptide (TPR) repeat protein